MNEGEQSMESLSYRELLRYDEGETRELEERDATVSGMNGSGWVLGTGQ